MKADRYRYDDHERPDLRDLPTHAGVDKDCREEIERRTAENIETMKQLQEALYADGREESCWCCRHWTPPARTASSSM